MGKGPRRSPGLAARLVFVLSSPLSTRRRALERDRFSRSVELPGGASRRAKAAAPVPACALESWLPRWLPNRRSGWDRPDARAADAEPHRSVAKRRPLQVRRALVAPRSGRGSQRRGGRRGLRDFGDEFGSSGCPPLYRREQLTRPAPSSRTHPRRYRPELSGKRGSRHAAGSANPAGNPSSRRAPPRSLRGRTPGWLPVF